MKLIRLESDVELNQSQFTNYLGVPLILKKNGKVALRTISAQFEEPPFIIDSSNDSFSFQTSDDYTVHNIVLVHGSYTIDTLCNMIQNQMNCVLDGTGQGIDPDNTDYGFMWLVSNTKDIDGYKITFSFDRSDNVVLDDTNTTLNNVDYDNTGDDPFFSKSVADDPDPNVINSYFTTKPLLCNGGFSTSFIINKQMETQPEDIVNSNWYMTIEPSRTLTGNQLLGDIVDRAYAMIGSFEGWYVYKKDNELQNPLEDNPADGDVVSISNNNGVIQYSVDTEDIVGDSLLSNFNDFGYNDLMVCLYIQKDDGLIGFFDCSITPNPNETVDSSGNYIKIDPSQLVSHRLRVDANASNVTINLLKGTQLLLGFRDSTLSLNAVSGSFESDGVVKSNIFDNDIVIEVPEFETACYDHTYKNKRNILSVITSGDIHRSTTGIGSEYWELSVSEVFPTFISLNNKQSGLSYSALTVRVSSQGNLLPLAGKMSCSLLFMDEEDD
jgi:hypothetical protein